MYCINCGKQVNDTDPFCPYCGTKLNSSANDAQPATPVEQVEELTPTEPTPVAEQPVAETSVVEQPVEQLEAQPAEVPAAPVEPIAEPAPAVEQPASQTPSVAPQPVVTPNQTAPAATVQQAQQPTNNKGKNNTLLLVIILVVVVIIGVVVIGKTFISSKEEPTTPASSTTTDPSAQEVVDNTDKTETYLGYTFTIPEGYQTKIDSKYGLIISSNDVAYSILIDFTNDYNKYYEALKAKYPTQAADLEKTVGTRKFLIGKVTSTNGATGSEYITAANGNASFVGAVLNKSNTVEYNDYKELATILDSSKESGSTFAAGDTNDPGKDGPIMFDMDRETFGFEK